MSGNKSKQDILEMATTCGFAVLRESRGQRLYRIVCNDAELEKFYHMARNDGLEDAVNKVARAGFLDVAPTLDGVIRSLKSEG